MRKLFSIGSCLAFCLCLSGARGAWAQEGNATTTELKQELRSDKQEIKEERLEIKENSEEARSEEKQLREQIKTAVEAGDTKTADTLRAQLRTMHGENVHGKAEDTKELRNKEKELKQDVKEARKEGAVPPGWDKDNNPPGPKGGPGTNWENPPGPKGGPGASPNNKAGKGH